MGKGMSKCLVCCGEGDHDVHPLEVGETAQNVMNFLHSFAADSALTENTRTEFEVAIKLVDSALAEGLKELFGAAVRDMDGKHQPIPGTSPST